MKRVRQQHGATVGWVIMLLVAGCSPSGGSFSSSGPEYKGEDLAADVKRTLKDTPPSVDITNVECADTEDIEPGAITDCLAVVNGKEVGIRVTWDDDEGHFTLKRSAPIPIE